MVDMRFEIPAQQVLLLLQQDPDVIATFEVDVDTVGGLMSNGTINEADVRELGEGLFEVTDIRYLLPSGAPYITITNVNQVLSVEGGVSFGVLENATITLSAADDVYDASQFSLLSNENQDPVFLGERILDFGPGADTLLLSEQIEEYVIE